MANTAPQPRVDRIPLTEAQKAARDALLFTMADAINALMGQDGIVYTKVPVTAPMGGPNART